MASAIAVSLVAVLSVTPTADAAETARVDVIGIHATGDLPLFVYRQIPGVSVQLAPTPSLFFDVGIVGLPEVTWFKGHLMGGLRARASEGELAGWIGPAIGVRYLDAYTGRGTESGLGISGAVVGAGQWWLTERVGLSLMFSAGANYWVGNGVALAIWNIDLTVRAGVVFARWW